MTRRGNGQARETLRRLRGGKHAGACSVLLLFFGVFFLAGLSLAQGTSVPKAAQTPTPAPKAPPKLSGGFGRPRATPAAPSSSGQLPADVDGAAEATRGKPAEKSTVSITNKTLITDPQKGRVSTVQASAPKDATAVSPPASRTITPESPFGTAGESVEAPSSGGPNGEAQWRAAARNARARVNDLKKRIEDLQREEAKLQNDFYAWDDGQYRDGVIKPAWDKKREELEAARKDLAEAEKELVELPEKARKAGALPGWLRE